MNSQRERGEKEEGKEENLKAVVIREGSGNAPETLEREKLRKNFCFALTAQQHLCSDFVKVCSVSC